MIVGASGVVSQRQKGLRNLPEPAVPAPPYSSWTVPSVASSPLLVL